MIEDAALSCAAPLIIFDELDKVKDDLLYFLITLYNRLEDQCGMVACGTEYLRKRIRAGYKHGDKGFEELYSRFGGRFINGPKVKHEEAVSIEGPMALKSRKPLRTLLKRA